MDVGAIVIVEAQSGTDENSSPSSAADLSSAPRLGEGTLAFLDVLGQSLLEHAIDRLLAVQAKLTSLIVHSDVAPSMPSFRRPPENLAVRVTDDPWLVVRETLETYRISGCDCVLVIKPTAYIEADFLDLLDFHRQGQRAITRASDREGQLDLWVMNCNATAEAVNDSLDYSLLHPDFFPVSYFVKEYVRRISRAEDFRQLVTDVLLARCRLRPSGEQRRPGIWTDQEVDIHRGARIVGPAYLGARCTIGERAVITRFSNIERDSYIDYGTVIENSSILPNTYVGICLDVRRSIAQGNRLLNLERGVLVEVSDPRLLRPNGALKPSKQAPLLVPKQAYGSSLPQESVVNRIRSINTSTEFES